MATGFSCSIGLFRISLFLKERSRTTFTVRAPYACAPAPVIGIFRDPLGMVKVTLIPDMGHDDRADVESQFGVPSGWQRSLAKNLGYV